MSIKDTDRHLESQIHGLLTCSFGLKKTLQKLEKVYQKPRVRVGLNEMIVLDLFCKFLQSHKWTQIVQIEIDCSSSLLTNKCEGVIQRQQKRIQANEVQGKEP